MFLANENFPYPSIELLRANGFIVYSIHEEYPGISDLEVLDLALKKSLIILTFDKDYGEIIFQKLAKSYPAVVFFRSKGHNPEMAANMLLSLISVHSFDFQNAFTVIENDSVRKREYM
ncbi:MAG: hypothetical protein RL660_1851 [Bacteroidota bacterium]|jgi:predicted nuclease of predicted toxin-antitoxin system